MNISDTTLRSYIDQIFNKYDRDRSNTLEVPELANFFNDVFALMGDPRRINQQQAYQALMAIDQNNDGRASKSELFNAFKKAMMLNQQQQGGYGQTQSGYGQGGYGQVQGGYGQGGYNQNQSGWGQRSNQSGMGSNQGSGWSNQGSGWGNQSNQGGWGNNNQGYGQGSQGGWANNQPNQGNWGGNPQQNYSAWGPTNGGGWGGGSNNQYNQRSQSGW